MNDTTNTTNTDDTPVFDFNTLPVTITYVAEVLDPWDSSKTVPPNTKRRKVDQWLIMITSKAGTWTTPYYTGLGLRTPAVVKKGLGGDTFLVKPAKPRTPTIANVMHSLMLDASAADNNFHDWSEELGYSSDNIKALDIYNSCCITARALRQHFDRTTLDAIRTAVQDM